MLSIAYLSEYIFVNAARLDLNAPEVGKFESGSNIANVEIFIIEPFFVFSIIVVLFLKI